MVVVSVVGVNANILSRFGFAFKYLYILKKRPFSGNKGKIRESLTPQAHDSHAA